MPSELRRVLSYSIAAFLKEAAVLIFVFSLLEKIVHTGGASLLWVLTSLLLAASFLLSGAWIEYRGNVALAARSS